jgi:hypothetical protein
MDERYERIPETSALVRRVMPLGTPASNGTVGPLAGLRHGLRQDGLRQIDRELALIADQLRSPDLPRLERWLLAGRRRELWTARWCVQRLLPDGRATDELGELAAEFDVDWGAEGAEGFAGGMAPLAYPPPTPATLMTPRALQSVLFDRVAMAFQGRLTNLTDTPLEIDILRAEKKRELLLLVLRHLEGLLTDARVSQVRADQLPDLQTVMLQDLWQAVATDFVGRYYTVQWGGQPVEVVAVVLGDRPLVARDILAQIPLVSEFLAHLLFQAPLPIDDTLQRAGSDLALARMEWLLQNLCIQVASAVMQPLLNRMGDVVEIKQTLYDQRLLSSREIERFRNDLSWKYRVARYFKEPTAIFESRHWLWVMDTAGVAPGEASGAGVGIGQRAIYCPRNQELATLSGIPYVVTLALETRDAIAPRLRTATAFLGRGVVYVLTEIVGRGIGLVGRGIIKGIGTALQDSKLGKSR